MRRLILTALLAAALAAALAACGGSSGGSDSAPATTAPAATTPAASSSAASGGAAIWDAECSGCHSPDPSGVGVSDAAEVRSVVENGAGDMPAFAGKLSAADIKAVSEFVAQAAQ